MASSRLRTCQWKSSMLMMVCLQTSPLWLHSWPTLTQVEDEETFTTALLKHPVYLTDLLRYVGFEVVWFSNFKNVKTVLQIWLLPLLVHSPLVHSIVLPLFICHSLLSSSVGSFILHLQEVHRGFPNAKFTPTHAVVATWENVAAYEEQARATGATNKVRQTKVHTHNLCPNSTPC